TLTTRDGRTRVADLHVPQSYDPTVPLPLVLNFHGFLSNPWEQELLTGMKQRSEARGFLLVYPQGSTQGIDPLSWNGPVCCPPAPCPSSTSTAPAIRWSPMTAASRRCSRAGRRTWCSHRWIRPSPAGCHATAAPVRSAPCSPCPTPTATPTRAAAATPG